MRSRSSRRKDDLLAAALERIPAIEAPRDAPHVHEEPAEDSDRVEPHGHRRRSGGLRAAPVVAPPPRRVATPLAPAVNIHSPRVASGHMRK
jgi:hypothetical protein